MTREALASKIDHTILKPDATPEQIEILCRQAMDYGFASVCVNPVYVPFAAKLLKDSNVMVCTVAGFPLGASSTAVKAFETEQAVRDGADEVDMVIAVGLLKSGRDSEVLEDIKAVVKAADGATVKVIIEACLLTDNEKERACSLCKQAGAHFVKTSTGFSSGGATAEDVKLMKHASGGLLVKAAGGIRALPDALAMLEAGADRIGASASVEIIKSIT
ncbi:MAG: deoxyribose-phosphate aldolase [Oscillospiraceae bacterium]|nr:deoxyribose-phosphate aldolase [Oscillospiraceae bacterium]